MAAIRSGIRPHLLKLAGALGVVALCACAGCAAKKADIPPPPPPSQVQPQTQGPVPLQSPSPPVPGQSPAKRGIAPPGAIPPSTDAGRPPADLLSGPMFVHKVRYPGESVSIIAGWYTGEIDNWKILAEVNPEINPNVIHEGMTIKIPESLMIKHEYMTREFVDSFYPKLKSKPKGAGSGREPAPAEEETPLFGPKH